MKRNKNWMFLLLIAGTTSACLDNPIDTQLQNGSEITQGTPELDESEFVSADPNAIQVNYGYDDNNQAAQNNGSTTGSVDDGEDRVAEEGDIYRVSSNAGIILNLNPYRGLQLIDFSDPTAPKIIGQAQISGEPVEMYQVGDFVYILMNNWWGYYTNQALGLTDRYNGGVIAVVDISDQTNPVIIKSAQVEGGIQTSRLTRGNDKESLYVASSKDGSAYVKSFSLSETGDLTSKDEIQLGGYVLDIQATGSHLLVSREVYDEDGRWVADVGSNVSVIDISDENGAMTEGGSVTVQGIVAKKSDMSFQGDILRVVSGNSWSSDTDTNHVETFNFSDLKNPTIVDAKTFGQGESLFATLFLKNSAFFVTFEQVDPFHSFSISDTGALVEESEFIVSGFNTWFRPVSDNTRLIGIGVDDKDGVRRPAVSLYNIEDLKNSNPLVDREDVASSWSDAIWDDKSFSILEKSASVMSDTGVLETGIVLLPFQGWDDTTDTYKTGVQIFTFSDTTLSKRGVMLHDTPVTRTFSADRSKDLTGNLSNLELSLYNTADVDAPTEVSRLPLAPDFTKVLAFGDHIARRVNKGAYWSWWGSNSSALVFDTIEVVSKTEIAFGEILAEIMIPVNSTLHKKDNLLVVIAQNSQDTTVSAWDFSDPTSPALKDTLTTSSIPAPERGYYGNDYYGEDDCYDCYGGYEQTPSAIVGNAIVFQVDKTINDFIGTLHRTRQDIYTYNEECDSYDDACTYVRGDKTCTYLKRKDGTVLPTTCDEDFESCTQDTTGAEVCTSISAPSNLEVSSEENEAYRSRKQRSFHIVDLSNADDLILRDSIVSNATEDVERTLKEDNLFHLSFNIPQPITHSTRNFTTHYFRTFDFTDPANIVVSNDINIPGRLVAADGNKLITKGSLWAADGVDQTLNRLELVSDKARLRAIKRFDQSYLDKVELADNKLYVTYYDNKTHLAVYPMTGAFSPLSDIELEGWLTFEEVANSRAIFSVEGGILIVNMDDLANPYLQAFLPMRAWTTDFLLEGNDLLVAAGLYGIYQFDVTTSNLPTP